MFSTSVRLVRMLFFLQPEGEYSIRNLRVCLLQCHCRAIPLFKCRLLREDALQCGIVGPKMEDSSRCRE